MIKWVLRRAIDKFERDWKYDAGYMRDIIDASPRAAWLFSRVTALGQFRRDLPIEAWCAAGITAVRHEDCGQATGTSSKTARSILSIRKPSWIAISATSPARTAVTCSPRYAER